MLATAFLLPMMTAAQPAAGIVDGGRLKQSGDSISVRRKLVVSINEFQDKWRKAWRAVEMKRHHNIDLNNIRGWIVQGNGVVTDPIWGGDRDARRLTSDVRRYEAILCYIGSPSDRAIEDAKARTAFKIGTPATSAEVAAVARRRAPREAPSSPRAATEAAQARLAQQQLAPSAASPLSSVVIAGGVTSATARIIRPFPDFGSICPSWIPSDVPLQLDEGEAIDLALPPAGREPLRRARETLIRELELAQAQLPSDEWIAGQRVRFVYDQRSPQRTIDAAQACVAETAFCLGLRALADEQAGAIVAAEMRYRAADTLARASAGVATNLCGNAEALLLLRGGDADRLRGQPCDSQRALLENMWWLADPLWSVPGNERLVAHESRRLHATLRAIGQRDERYVWQREGGGDAMRELVVRYGWPGYTYWPGVKFEDEINTYLENVTTRSVFMPHTAMEYSIDRTSLIPSLDAIIRPFELRSSQYQLNVPDGKAPEEWWPQEHMMLFTKLKPLGAGQDARFRRDSTITFHLAVDNPLHALDTAGTGPSRSFLMGGYAPMDNRIFAASTVTEGEALRLSGSFPSEPVVLSAEVLPRTLKEQAMRLRYGWRPPPTLAQMGAGEVALSDPVFLLMPERDVIVPNDEKTVMPFMAGSLSFDHGDPLGVYWESYGFRLGDTLNVNVTVRRDGDVNALRRVGAALGVASSLRDSISVSWTEFDGRNSTLISGGNKPVIGRSVRLDLKALSPGKYVILIEIRTLQRAARSERHFTISG
ncbi:MAG: hypothetical protein ABI120_18735 [Gemmatimonadaceae bacterium]